MLIRALPSITQSHPEVLYAIVGDGEELTALKSLTARLSVQERVQFLNDLPDEKVIKCYQQCTLFVLPNRTEGRDIEGFGMVLAEAQACGKAVLAGASGGTSETMLVGTSGDIVDCTAPAELADTIISLLSQPHLLQQRGLHGRAHVCSNLDWPIHVQQAITAFERFS
jgi:phosphatidylinositol alpha-1,6-mannosyltransferase